MPVLEIFFPGEDKHLDQNEEYFILQNGTKKEKIFFHDYQRIYKTPGLYEEIFHKRLQCRSPGVIKDLLMQEIDKGGTDPATLRILDYGAGSGLVAEALHPENPELIVGIDILEEAKEAAFRERGGLYRDYFVTDLAAPEDEVMQQLQAYNFNALVTVAALGFGHIPPESFVNAFNLIENKGWVAFNLRDRFLTRTDDSGFREVLDFLSNDHIDLLQEKTYVHRLSSFGEPIHYTAIVGRKKNDLKI